MRKAGSTHELGRAAFWKGITKFTDDDRLMDVLSGLSGREGKQEEVANWKAGWEAAKADSETPVEAPKKKTSKKKSKK